MFAAFVVAACSVLAGAPPADSLETALLAQNDPSPVVHGPARAGAAPEPVYLESEPAPAPEPRSGKGPVLLIRAGYGLEAHDDREGVGLFAVGAVVPIAARWEAVGQFGSHPRRLSGAADSGRLPPAGGDAPYRIQRTLASLSLGLRFRLGDTDPDRNALRVEFAPTVVDARWVVYDNFTGDDVQEEHRLLPGIQTGVVLPARLGDGFLIEFGLLYLVTLPPAQAVPGVETMGIRQFQISLAAGIPL